MIRLNVFVRVNESNREEAIKAAKELTACSLKEEGCIAYDTFESSTRHDVFMICETWQNAEVLAAHEKTAHFAEKIYTIETPDNPRALPAKELAKAAREFNPGAESTKSIADAVEKAFAYAGDDEKRT